MAPATDHQGRVERLIQHLRDEPRTDVVLSLFMWKGMTYIGEECVGAPPKVGEILGKTITKDLQALMLRTLLSMGGADAYLFATEAHILQIHKKTGEKTEGEVLLLHYQSTDGTRIDRVFNVSKPAETILLGEEINLPDGSLGDGRFTNLFEGAPEDGERPEAPSQSLLRDAPDNLDFSRN